jgi:hypothetical protein
MSHINTSPVWTALTYMLMLFQKCIANNWHPSSVVNFSKIGLPESWLRCLISKLHLMILPIIKHGSYYHKYIIGLKVPIESIKVQIYTKWTGQYISEIALTYMLKQFTLGMCCCVSSVTVFPMLEKKTNHIMKRKFKQWW